MRGYGWCIYPRPELNPVEAVLQGGKATVVEPVFGSLTQAWEAVEGMVQIYIISNRIWWFN